MFAALALSLVQGPPTFPPHNYQPHLIDPGLHGGRISHTAQIYDGPSDFTSDGRVRISFRTQEYFPDLYTWAVVASAVDPERIQSDANGHLSAFYDASAPQIGDFLGQDFAMSSNTESKVIYWSPAFVGADTETTDDDDRCTLDPGLPRPNGGGNANVTLVMRALDPSGPEKGENPYPSDSSGAFQPDGGYRTYQISMVTDHFGSAADWVCDASGFLHWTNPPSPEPPRLVVMNLTVVLHPGPTPTITSATVQKPFTLLTIGATTTTINGVEPSITADGTLIIFNGDGGAGGFSNKVTYVWNPAGCQGPGWSVPLSVTQVPPPEFGSAATLPAFARSYGFAKYPIREPDNYQYSSGEVIGGPYPWLSKDGSFFIAMHTRALEAAVGLQLPRCGMFVCGEITGGYIKNIDDAALNPTRLGGSMKWPQTAQGLSFTLPDTGRTTVFSTGFKPGLWEPLIGDSAPVPTQLASARIPILPLFVFRTRQYGEVRFEEADGNYLLYLACNESFKANDCVEPFECALTNREMDPRKTPDTSGRSPRAICSLNDGAGFPPEVLGGLLTPNFVQTRQVIGAAIGAAGQPLHENCGFKGQALSFSPEGNVQVSQSGWGSYGAKLTVEIFVKVAASSISGDWSLVEDPGRFLLTLKADGSIRGSIQTPGGTIVVQSVAGVVTTGQNPANPGVGWRHVALVYNGNAKVTTNHFTRFVSTLKLYGDGVLIGSTEWPEQTSLGAPSSLLYVGPGRGTPSAPVSFNNVVLLLDEVSISPVLRTLAEIQRDAYVAPAPDAFGPLPNDVTLPNGLERSESKWPLGLAYSAAKVSLGDALFGSPILSKNLDRSCETCHIPTDFFADALPRATAEVAPHANLQLNVPTVLNMAFGTHKFFDGRADSVEDQVLGPITGQEMGPQVIGTVLNRIKADSGSGGLLSKFDAAYTPLANNAHVNEANLEESLAMYIRTFLTGDSAFDQDRQLRATGSGVSLSAAAQRGRALFFGKARCFGCHRGTNFSDDSFHNIGSVLASTVTGRGGITGRTQEVGQLKTPTLRNVAQTGPWFHDGSKTTLAQVIDHYNGGFVTGGGVGVLDRELRPLGLTTGEKSDLEVFLSSLTGTVSTQ